MLLSFRDLFEYIPHRPPMVLVSTLIDANQERGESQYTITETSLFTQAGVLTAAGLYENMAQTEALRSGYLGTGVDAKGLGYVRYVGAITDGKIHQHPKVGDEIRTVTLVEHALANASLILGEVFLKETLIAEARLKLFIPESV